MADCPLRYAKLILEVYLSILLLEERIPTYPKDCSMCKDLQRCRLPSCDHMSNGLNLLHPRKDVAEMVIVFRVSPIVPEGLVFVGMK